MGQCRYINANLSYMLLCNTGYSSLITYADANCSTFMDFKTIDHGTCSMAFGEYLFPYCESSLPDVMLFAAALSGGAQVPPNDSSLRGVATFGWSDTEWCVWGAAAAAANNQIKELFQIMLFVLTCPLLLSFCFFFPYFFFFFFFALFLKFFVASLSTLSIAWA